MAHNRKNLQELIDCLKEADYQPGTKARKISNQDFVKGCPLRGFNLGSWIHKEKEPDEEYGGYQGTGCGTPSCIAGYAEWLRQGRPTLMKANEWNVSEQARIWLGLNLFEADMLFMYQTLSGDRANMTWGKRGRFVRNPNMPTMDNVQPADAVKVLEHLRDTGQVDWSIIERQPQA